MLIALLVNALNLLYANDSIACKDERILFESVYTINGLCHKDIEVDVIELLQSEGLLLIVRLKFHAEADKPRWSRFGDLLYLSHLQVLLVDFIGLINDALRDSGEAANDTNDITE